MRYRTVCLAGYVGPYCVYGAGGDPGADGGHLSGQLFFNASGYLYEADPSGSYHCVCGYRCLDFTEAGFCYQPDSGDYGDHPHPSRAL